MTQAISMPSADSSDEVRFPIRELSLKTGVNSVTLRAWERRYGLLKPKRTDKGHRLYDQGDVLRVEGILRWIQQGVAVSKVRALLEQETTAEGAPSTNGEPDNEWLDWRYALVAASKSYQEEKIAQLYQDVFSQYPVDIAIRDWILPSFEQLGKGPELAFCESVVLNALVHRVGQYKTQPKNATKVLVTGLSSQRIVWCYMAAAMLLDKGVSCLVLPNAYHSDDWSKVVAVSKVQAVLAFCDNDLAAKSTEILANMGQWQKPVAAIGAGFWLAAHEEKATRVGLVNVYSEALEGVSAFISSCQNR